MTLDLQNKIALMANNQYQALPPNLTAMNPLGGLLGVDNSNHAAMSQSLSNNLTGFTGGLSMGNKNWQGWRRKR